MSVYKNDIKKLFTKNSMNSSQWEFLISRMTEQMLLVLEYLDNQQKIHQNVKSVNILYQDDNFYLSDFSETKIVDEDKSYVDTDWYRASEFYQQELQTTKIDIYSLKVIIVECFEWLSDKTNKSHEHDWHKK